MANQEIRKACVELIERAEVVFLTTIDSKGYPQTRALLNLRNKKQFPKLIPFQEGQDEFTVYFSTNMPSQKISQIRDNPKISAYFCDARIFHGLMLGGEIEIITDPAIKHAIWHDDWTMYYPDGVDGAEYGILRLRPTVARGWYQMNKFEINLKP